MKSYKLNRLFNRESGKCFDVAVDHGFFNELSFLSGIESVERAVSILVDAAPDAIQLTVGQAHYLQSIKGKKSPRLCYAQTWQMYTAKICQAIYSAG
jgi:DhnA family fructose-bisphosphate aldolase class Ia